MYHAFLLQFTNWRDIYEKVSAWIWLYIFQDNFLKIILLICSDFLYIWLVCIFVQTDTEAKRLKTFKSTDENDDIKTEAEASLGISSKLADQNPQPPEAPKQDYIHVRARRGQATDSHSLAERVSMIAICMIVTNTLVSPIFYQSFQHEH